MNGLTSFSQDQLPTTANDWLSYGERVFDEAGVFLGHGRDNLRDEAAALIVYALGIKESDDELILHQTLTESQIKRLQTVFHRRVIKREPVAYIIQKSYFAGIPFFVDHRVIIPRSPIAELIVGCFQPFISDKKEHRLLDMCCGSGCLGIAAWAHCGSITKIDFCDLSKEALDVVAINLSTLSVDCSTNLLQGDGFSGVEQHYDGDTEKKPIYDIILYNPPYVSQAEMAQLPPEYSYEPSIALDGSGGDSSDQDGLSILRSMMVHMTHYLAEDGWLFLEVGMSYQAFEKEFCELDFYRIELVCEACGVYAVSEKSLRQWHGRKQSA